MFLYCHLFFLLTLLLIISLTIANVNSSSPNQIFNEPDSLAFNENTDRDVPKNELQSERRALEERKGNGCQVGKSEICDEKSTKQFSIYSPTSLKLNRDSEQRRLNKRDEKNLEVYIRTLNNSTRFNLGASLTIECRFETNLNQDLKFHLRWLRSVAGWAGNQSISATEARSPTTIIAATTRVWTVQRNGGLDLELNDFQPADVGDYFCQAVSPKQASELESHQEETIISESRVRLTILDQDGQLSSNEISAASQLQETLPTEPSETPPLGFYSQESLSKLLPSLKVIPDFAQVALGAQIQLVCVANDLEQPDPELHEVEWTFEAYSSRLELLSRAPIVAERLPYNVSTLGGVLIVWSMAEDHIGIYRCRVRLPEFNLTGEAVGELTLRPPTDSAPLVSVSPELIRLSPNSSATIQCEATGYPAPELSWYRVDGTQPSVSAPADEANSSAGESSSSLPANPTNLELLLAEGGIEIERIQPKDTAIYCQQSKCALQSQRQIGAAARRTLVSALELVHLRQTRAQHQGQYVCRASNQHGSNQASSIVDVEFREPPVVRIKPEHREQTIELKEGETAMDGGAKPSVSFKCSIESGRPVPKLRWLRTSSANSNAGSASTTTTNNMLSNWDNLDVYDLTRISSATSNVSALIEDNGRSLRLLISTISLDDEGDYVCLAENEWGRDSATAKLIVRKAGSIRIVQASPKVARVNESFHLECLAFGHPLPLDIEWSRSDRGAFFSLISRSASPLSSHERAVLKFDRVNLDDSGEYTCNARDPLNSTLVLRDTIMVLVEMDVEDKIKLASEQTHRNTLFPKLMVRPTKINAPAGSNLTLDCLAVSGLQPTLVEWIAPAGAGASFEPANASALNYYVRPYYRATSDQFENQLFQFGSKLKINNVSKAHEGVYQCKGRNKIGVENAPALINVISAADRAASEGSLLSADEVAGKSAAATKTKVAKMGSNIELKCQVNGIEQPATSWSRDGLELPQRSVQIGHNLWIQNVSQRDNGLYICSARSKEPNRVIQAKINLLVRGTNSLESSASAMAAGRAQLNLSAKIVASKSSVNIGDSITLECIVSQNVANNNSSADLDEIERNVVWTNLHSGQSLFQANVYIQSNLLIIYELKPENSAIYRCNYNELSQHVDHKLQLGGDDLLNLDSAASGRQTKQEMLVGKGGQEQQQLFMKNFNQLVGSDGRRVELRQVSVGSSLTLNCSAGDSIGNSSPAGQTYLWLRGDSLNAARMGAGKANGSQLEFDTVQTEDADTYHCYSSTTIGQEHKWQHLASHLVHIPVSATRFVQRPVSFITLPSISGAEFQLWLELRFQPERDSGLILFNGQQQLANKSPAGDYILLGLVRGHLEFRFELGDGLTWLRSLQPVSLNHWHKVVIERNRRGAIMWLDKQPAVSNSSTGKFFNLNLDSFLYVGGHQYFATTSSGRPNQRPANSSANNSATNRPFHGYSRGFQGCISFLRISGNEINLASRNRSVSVGVYECDHSSSDCECNSPNGICQLDVKPLNRTAAAARQATPPPTVEQLSSPNYDPDLRCICVPGSSGDHCEQRSNFNRLEQQQLQSMLDLKSPAQVATTTPESTSQVLENNSTSSMADKTPLTSSGLSKGACELLRPCSSNGTLECQSLTSTSFKCHCKLGFVGVACGQSIQFSSETSVAFGPDAYLQFRFQPAGETLANPAQAGQSGAKRANQFNATAFARLSSMAEQQNISFSIQTNSSYGLIFYTGQAGILGAESWQLANSQLVGQHSKSMFANLLARLSASSSMSSLVADYLAIALVDGHVELSYELGSGVAILRSSNRVNDENEHQIRVLRTGKQAQLIIDNLHKHEASSPGKLSMLNSQPEIYLGGLPGLAELTNNMYMSGFVGCLANLEINSLGPLNLIRSDQLTQVRSARNLAPCKPASNSSSSSSAAAAASSPPDLGAKHKPYQSPATPESEDPDEM